MLFSSVSLVYKYFVVILNNSVVIKIGDYFMLYLLILILKKKVVRQETSKISKIVYGKYVSLQ